MNKSRIAKRQSRWHWFKYLLVFLLGIMCALLLFIIFFPKEPKLDKKIITRQSTSISDSQSSVLREQTSDTQQSSYPYKVDLPNNQSLNFKPKGNNVGTLHDSISVTLSSNSNNYKVYFSHNYRDNYDSFESSANFIAQVNTIPTKEIFVRGYGSTPQRNVSINTEIVLNDELSNTGDQFSDWQGTKLFLFTASDGSLSLAVPDVDEGKNGNYIEYQQQ